MPPPTTATTTIPPPHPHAHPPPPPLSSVSKRQPRGERLLSRQELACSVSDDSCRRGRCGKSAQNRWSIRYGFKAPLKAVSGAGDRDASNSKVDARDFSAEAPTLPSLSDQASYYWFGRRCDRCDTGYEPSASQHRVLGLGTVAIADADTPYSRFGDSVSLGVPAETAPQCHPVMHGMAVPGGAYRSAVR